MAADQIILGQYSVGLRGRSCAARASRTVIPSNRDATPKPRFQRNLGGGGVSVIGLMFDTGLIADKNHAL